MKLKTYHKQLQLDKQTPVGLYLQIRDQYANSILLESSDYNSREGNYSIIGLRPISTFKAHEKEIQILENNTLQTIDLTGTDLITELNNYINSFQTESIPFKFPYSAVFGYCSFDSIPLTENIVFSKGSKEVEIPLVYYSFYSLLIVFDHFLNQLHVVCFDENTNKAEQLTYELLNNLKTSNTNEYIFESIGEITSSTTDENYLNSVELAKAHCKFGDVFQLVLSKRFKQNFIGDEFNVYRALKQINPSPYLFYFDYGAFKLFGSSPEAQLIINDSKAEIHPIAGTYKRTQNDELDRINATNLGNDPKENAEHMMLVDLARNDLSTCCNNVKVDVLKQTQFYSHVIHLVSKVTGQLKTTASGIELLFRSFPAGTLSGAPKHKAMELINQYEAVSRNFYGGCIGYIETNGNINHAIMIRSFLSYNNQLHFQAGAGIVIDSVPANELQEVYNKVGALKKAIKEANKLNNITNFTANENFSSR